MSKSLERLKAIKLRREGASIKDIARNIGVSRSSVSIWCRDIQLTKEQDDLLMKKMIAGGHKGRMLGAARNKEKRLSAIRDSNHEGRSLITSLNQREFLIAGLALYWAEGSKKEGKLVLTNSDPELILFMKSWFEKCFGVAPAEFMPRISIMESHKDRIGEVLSFWSTLLGLEIVQFGNPTFLKSSRKKAYDNHNSYFGVLRLGVRKGTRLKYRILGLIQGLANSKKPA